MFPIIIKQDLPVDQVVIRSVAVRGYLGPMSVWISNPRGRSSPWSLDGYNHWGQDAFTCLYEKQHAPSRRTYQRLELQQPLVLRPGDERVLYIHSTAPHDRAVVYDNSYAGQNGARYEDAFLQIRTGKAHLSPEVFGETPIWGWGSAWRSHREFVGQVEYGIRYNLWQPERHLNFGRNFQQAAHTLFACQRRLESPMARLPDECIHYILNLCRWDWFDDDQQEMNSLRRRRLGHRSIFSLATTTSSSSTTSTTTRGDTPSRPTVSLPRQERPFRFGLVTARNMLTAASSS